METEETVDQEGQQEALEDVKNTQPQKSSVDDLIEGMEPDEVKELIAALKAKKSSAYDEAKQYRLAKQKAEQELEELKRNIEQEKTAARRKEMSKIEALEDQLREREQAFEDFKAKNQTLQQQLQDKETRLLLLNNDVSNDPDAVDTVSTMLHAAKQREGENFDFEEWLTSAKSKYPSFFVDAKKPSKPADPSLPPASKKQKPGQPPESKPVKLRPGDKDEQKEYARIREEKYGLSPTRFVV